MNALELTTAINTLAVSAAKQWDTDELALIAAILTQLGDTLATIAALRVVQEAKNCKSIAE